MEEQIKELESQIKKLKEVYRVEQKKSYENKSHKNFNEGDIVTNGSNIGIVGWTENKACNCSLDSGYMGISLINGSRGFLAFAKRDEYEIVKDEYYINTHAIYIQLTGLEIESLKDSLGNRNCNPTQTKTKLIDILDDLHT